jgi:two-component system, OmpR family, sensor histidine kinase VicK
LSDKKPLLAKLINLVVDNKFSLTVELKDGTRERMRRNEEGIGLTTYSNSESTLSSYASIFETHSVDTK